MSLMDQKGKLEILADITKRMRQRFELRDYGNRTYFTDGSGSIFNICAFPGRPALVIEYTDNAKDAACGALEDGDPFYLDDFADMNALFNAMLSEIEAV